LKLKQKRGAVLLEMLLALAVGSAILSAVSGVLAGGHWANLHSSQSQQAGLYLQEAEEVVKSLAKADWSAVALTGLYHPEVNSGQWQLPAGEENLGIYTRGMEIEDVFRDEEGEIASQAGTLDPCFKKVTVNLDWNEPRPASLTQTFFLSRWRDNQTWIEDSLADFSDGEEDATDATISPGSVQLAQTGGGGWSEPKSLGTVDGRSKASGIWATDEYIYLTWDKFIGGIEVFDIQDSPATPSSRGSFGFTYRPNDCAATNGYLYVADSFWILPSVNIYDIGEDPFDPPYIGSEGLLYAAGGLWATDDYLFVSAKDFNLVLVYQLSGGHYENPSYKGLFFTPEDTVDLAVSGSYLYVAQESTAKAVEIYDISSNPASPIHAATMTTLYQPTGIWAESNILYLSMEGKRGAMYSLSAEPTNPQLYGYFPTERNTADVAAFGDYGYIAGADSQSKVIEIFDLSDSKGVSGIYFVYGEYISSVFEASSSAAFNRISWEGQEPAGTDILFQIALNDDNSTWNFVGSEGDPASYFEEPGGFPLNNLLGQFLKYKIILTGNGDVTPVVEKVMVNYSP